MADRGDEDARRSSRTNLGVPPDRYGEWISKLPADLFASTRLEALGGEEAAATEDPQKDYLDEEIESYEKDLKERSDFLKVLKSIRDGESLSGSPPTVLPDEEEDGIRPPIEYGGQENIAAAAAAAAGKSKYGSTSHWFGAANEDIADYYDYNDGGFGVSPITKTGGGYYRPTPNLQIWKDPSLHPRRPVRRPTGPPPVPPQKPVPLQLTPPERQPLWKQSTPRRIAFQPNPSARAFQPAAMTSTPAPPSSGIDALAHALIQTLQVQNKNTEKFVARQSSSSNLPIFAGNPLEWPLFAHHYGQSTADCEFTQAQNMTRLEKALRGEARSTVRSLMIVPNNADAVMERLEQRYGRPEYVIRALMDLARKTPSPKEGKLNTLVDFSNAIANLVSTVKTLQVPAYMENPQLLQELVDKLPDILKLQWGLQKVLMKSDNLEHFSNWIMKIAEAASVVTMPKFTWKDSKDSKRDEHLYSVKETTAVASSSSGSSSSSPRPCPLCKKTDHELYSCEDYKKKTVDKRWEFLEGKNICFCCLKAGHSRRRYRSKATCKMDGCGRRHHTLLHGPFPKKDERKPDKPDEKEVEEINATMSSLPSASILRIIVVKLYGPAGEMTVNALLDEGSTVTLVCSKVAKELGLSGVNDPIRINWTNGAYQRDSSSQKIDILIGPYGTNEKFKMKRARTLVNLKLPPQRSDLRDIVKRFEHLQNQKLHYLPGSRPLILIGQPHVHLTLARGIIEADDESPVVTKTKLGWVLHGPCVGISGKDSLFSCSHESDDDIIHHLVKESFALDSIGILPAVTNRSREDKAAEERIKLVTRRIGERWETGLLWRKEPVELPRSRDVAFHRLLSIERKLRKNDEIRKQYHEKIDHYLKKGYARKLTPEELDVPNKVEWYLPHFDRQHPNKPGKIRIVFDAASRANGRSLNDYLLTGPDLLRSLPGVLLQFRERKIAFSGDITEMFHQVRIRKEDCPAQRILFRHNEDEDPSVLQLEVMMFGSVCSPFCAQYVKNVNASEFQKEFPAATQAIITKHYMDDYLQSLDTDEEAVKLIREVTEVHRRGGFEIGKWISNSKCLLEEITGVGAETSKDLAEWSEVPTQRALGLHWIPEEDKFTFRVNLDRAGKGIATGEAVPTKRAVLRLLMLVWDPLGFLGHYLIRGKIILQDLWKLQVGWDDEVPESVRLKWKTWIVDLPKLPNVRISRCYSEEASSSECVQLHLFADSSELAGCAVAYLRVVETSGQVAVSFIMSKTRVASVKPVSIPRLELQAALLAARLGKFIKEQLEIKVHSIHFWTDSMTTIKWIRSEARKSHPFVAFRVGEIQEITNIQDWRWIPTKENPADDATREGKSNLEEDARWWNGPQFLKMHEDFWPVEKICTRDKPRDNVMDLSMLFMATIAEPVPMSLPNISRFSRYMRLVRTTAWMQKFIECMGNGRKPRSTLLDIRKAEIRLFRRSQWEDFPLEMQLMQNEEDIPKFSPLYELSPELDNEGCLRMRSKLNEAQQEGLRKPIILHPKNELTRLLVEHYHAIFAHQGEDTIRNELRQRFYIPRNRNAIRKVIRGCRICKLRKAKPHPPMMGALPKFRYQPQPRAFSICGMDYFGPLEITVKRSKEKRYGVLITCLSTRAVHLEVAHSLTTDSCIMAIRRMISRRGQPLQIYSDNGTNLRGAEKELRQSLRDLDQGKLTSELSVKGIDWHFIPPSAPHMGGTWERLVRSVKTAIMGIMKSRPTRDEILRTLFAEAEAIINSRPLTDVPVDVESPEALTPSHFLIGSSSSSQPPGEFDKDDLDLRKLWRQSQALADMFWKRWMKEYIPTLQRRKKWHKAGQLFEIGDVVVVLDESLRRNTWPLGIVTQVFPGKDGTVRVADVKTVSGVYKRPVVKLAKLDIKTSDAQDL